MRTPSTDGRAKGAKLQRAGGSDGLLQALICGAQFIAEALQGCLDALAALVKTSFRDEAVPLGFDFFPLLLCFHGPEVDLNLGFVPELGEIRLQVIKCAPVISPFPAKPLIPLSLPHSFIHPTN